MSPDQLFFPTVLDLRFLSEVLLVDLRVKIKSRLVSVLALCIKHQKVFNENY